MKKAFAFKMKLDAEKHQGKTSGQDVQKCTRDNISEDMSGRQVQRYIRLTELIPELLQLVDNNKMAISPKEQIKFKVEKLQDYFPKGYTTKQMQDTIEKLLKQYMQRWKNRNLER